MVAEGDLLRDPTVILAHFCATLPFAVPPPPPREPLVGTVFVLPSHPRPYTDFDVVGDFEVDSTGGPPTPPLDLRFDNLINRSVLFGLVPSASRINRGSCFHEFVRHLIIPYEYI